MNRRSKVKALMVMLFVGVIAAPTAFAAESDAPTLFPENSVGYVHFVVDELLQTPSLSFPQTLAQHVPQELAEFTVSRFGLDVTDLASVTVVIPSPEVFATNKAADKTPFLITATFNKPFSRDTLVDRLPEGWSTESVDGTNYYANSGEAIAVVADRTVMFGSDATIQWSLTAKNQADKLTRAFQSSDSDGQISAFVNLKSIPSQFLANVPPSLQPFLKANGAKLVMNLSDGYRLTTEWLFTDAAEAETAATQANDFLALGKHQLTETEKSFQEQIDNDTTSLEEGFQNVLNLALVRHLQQHLDEVQVTSQDRALVIQVETDHDLGEVVLIGLTSVRKIGIEAGQQFDEIADQIAK